MKNSIISCLVAFSLAVALTACDENSWNDHLDGFDGSPAITDLQTIEYTLTDADYAAIAANSTNQGLVEADALAAVGSQHYFTEAAPASKLVPAFLSSTSFKYFTLSDGSAIKLTYNVAEALPEEVTAMQKADQYVISDEDYVQAWGSDENYIEAYTPSVSPSRYIPRVLANIYDDALSGDYVVVNYNYSEQEPIFGNVGGGDEPSGFVMSDVLGALTLDSTVDVNGVVTAKCTQGYILTDNGGSVFVYYGKTFDYNSCAIGDQVVLSATVGSYNTGFQLVGSSAVMEVVGHEDYKYPTPKVYTGSDLDAVINRSENATAIYAQITGEVAVNGNNINIILPDAETAQGSAYYTPDDLKGLLQSGSNVTVTGYFIAVAGHRYCNFVITNVTAVVAKAPVAAVPTTNMNAVYMYNGTSWSQPANAVVLQPADYVAMGQTYGNLSNQLPAQLLPIYLAKNYPYAQAEDVKYVLYKYYNGSATAYKCDQYVYSGSEWVLNDGVTTETAQFVKSKGVWNYDPSVSITLPAGRSQALSTLYYQACVDWVYENVDKPLGSTDIKSGKYYVSSYGNNEYYCGTSAYQGNVDLRADKAKEQYPTGYEGMSDDEILELMRQRFAYQVMPGALKALHADAAPVDGIDVLYTINFAVYTGSTSTYTIVYKVTAPATFECVSCDWWDGGEPATKLDLEKYMK